MTDSPPQEMPTDESRAGEARTEPKVFGIGMYKTGTTSLARALQRLGYKTRKKFEWKFGGREAYFEARILRATVRSIDRCLAL